MQPFTDDIRPWMKALDVLVRPAIGTHTCTHPHLTRIPLAEAREEIRSSRLRLEDLFGDPVRDLVQEAGFLTTCTTETGGNRVGMDPLKLRRFTARYASRHWKNLLRWLRDATR